MSQITTHILNTSSGKPAQGVRVNLKKFSDDNWILIGFGNTNADGRVTDLIDEGVLLDPGTYCLVFKTADYFSKLNTKTFYPEVNIVFETTDTEHYHVPLLLNPFGYSTYRGS
jgi:hydroxyisourate hydrolase